MSKRVQGFEYFVAPDYRRPCPSLYLISRPLIEPYVRISRIRLSDSLSRQGIHEELKTCTPYGYTSP